MQGLVIAFGLLIINSIERRFDNYKALKTVFAKQVMTIIPS